MALTAGMVYECNASGDEAYGGGFDSSYGGTDRSQTTTPYVEDINGGAIVATIAATNTRLTFTLGHTVTTGDKGNIFYIKGGTSVTVGHYLITDVDTGTNEWVLDRSPGATGTLPTGNMGGAKSHLKDLSNPTSGSTPLLAGNTAYCKGTFTFTTSPSSTVASIGQIKVRGYATARDDGTQATFNNGANSNTLVVINNAATTGWEFHNIIFDGVRGTYTSGRGVNVTTGNASFFNCDFKSFNNNAVTGSNKCSFFNCKFYDNTTAIVANFSNIASFHGCVFRDNTFSVLQAQSNSRVNVSRCLFYSNTGASTDSVVVNGSSGILDMYNCTIHAAGRYGVSTQGTTGILNMVNTIITDSGTNAVHTSAAVPSINMKNTAIYGNATTGVPAIAEEGTITLSGLPYVDETSDDYRLNTTAGEGAACANLGYPSTIEGQNSSISVGVFEVPYSSGGSGTVGYGSIS